MSKQQDYSKGNGNLAVRLRKHPKLNLIKPDIKNLSKLNIENLTKHYIASERYSIKSID